MRASLRSDIPRNPASITDIIACDPGEVTELDLDGVALDSLPADVDRLCKLEYLTVMKAGVKDLPASFAGLRRLAYLDLCDNKLIEVPEVLADMPALKLVFLSRNPIAALPAWVSRMDWDTLDFLDTAITSITARDLPTGLRSIGIDGNLPGVEEMLRECVELAGLYLGGRVPKAVIEALRCSVDLSELFLQHPASWPPTLPRLKWLDVLGCEDRNLPGWLAGSMIERLWIRNCGLTDLPAALADAPKLREISITGTALKEPLASVARLGSDAILAYLRARKAGESVVDEAKLVLVGEGKVGKSTLVNALAGKPFVKNRDSTHGIELGRLALPHPDRPGASLTLNTWDFGGQEVYRITHQFFYGSQAVTLLLWEPRRGCDQCDVEGWLRRLAIRLDKDARVIVVSTHADDHRQPELDWPKLEREFGPMLVGRMAVDSESGTGLDELKRLIAATAVTLRPAGGTWPTAWVAVRDALIAKRDACVHSIPWGDFAALCRDHAIPEDNQPILAQLLHDLGHILHFGDDDTLRDIVILDAEWVSKAVSRVLEDPEVHEQGGILRHERLKDIWSRDGNDWKGGFDRAHHAIFLKLMERFDASYRCRDTPGVSLVPQKLSLARPDHLPWTADTPPEAGERELRLVCETENIAPGLMPWLIARLHHSAEPGRQWRTGAYLRHRLGAKALIELQAERRLSVVVRAPSPDYFFTLLHDGLETLIEERWPGLSRVYKVPCPQKDGAEPCAGWFDLDDVRRYREKGRRTIECRLCLNATPVDRLLTGFEPPPEDACLQRIEQKLDVLSSDLNARAVELRRMLKSLGDEARDCPPLFTLVPRDRSALDPRTLVNTPFTLRLWCSHPGHLHPVAEYTITMTREWLAKAAPYLRFAADALRLVVPVGGAVGLAMLESADAEKVRDDVGAMAELARNLPALEGLDDRDHAARVAGLRRAEGPDLRWLKSVLTSVDPSGHYGGLTMVVDRASGDIHWVCPEHKRDYDGGPVVL